jgi:hypothetical protein
VLVTTGHTHQKGYAERTDEVMEGGRELLAGGTTGRQPGAAAASGETQSSRLPSDMVDVVVGRGRRRGQPKGAAASKERMEGGVEHQPPLLLHRRGRQAAPESTEMLSSSRIDHADVICLFFLFIFFSVGRGVEFRRQRKTSQGMKGLFHHGQIFGIILPLHMGEWGWGWGCIRPAI